VSNNPQKLQDIVENSIKMFLILCVHISRSPYRPAVPKLLMNRQFLEAKNLCGQILWSKAHGGQKITILTIKIALILYCH